MSIRAHSSNKQASILRSISPSLIMEMIILFSEIVCAIDDHLLRLLDVDHMFGYKLRQISTINAPRDIVPGGYRWKGAGIIVESDGVIESGIFGGHSPVAQHALAAIVKPPGRSQFHRRIMAGQWCQFS